MANKHYQRFYANRSDIEDGPRDAQSTIPSRSHYHDCTSPAGYASMSISAVPKTATAQEYTPFQPDIGHITSPRGTKHNLFLQLGKAITSGQPKVYQQVTYQPDPNTSFLLPPTPTTPVRVHDLPPAAPASPTDKTLITSQLQAEIPSPMICEDWDDFMAGCPKPITYMPYRPGNDSAASGSAVEAPVLRRRGTTYPRPVATFSVQDADYTFVDLVSPSELTPESANSGPKYSFDENALPDWEIVSRNVQSIRRSRQESTVPTSLSMAHHDNFVLQSGDSSYFSHTTN